MAKKKTGESGKRFARRVEPTVEAKEEEKLFKPEPEKPRIPERIREKDAGFGVIKTVAAVVMALIVGSVILFNQAGGRESSRGDKLLGELCEETMECATGSMCFSYKGLESRCIKRCGNEKQCDPGYTCVSASERKIRKGIRVADICVENDKL